MHLLTPIYILLFCFSKTQLVHIPTWISTSPHELIVSQSLLDFLGKWEAFSHCETKSVRWGGPSQFNRIGWDKSKGPKLYHNEWVGGPFLLVLLRSMNKLGKMKCFWIHLLTASHVQLSSMLLAYNLLTYKVLRGSEGADALDVHEKWRNRKLARGSGLGSIISRTRISNFHAHYPIITTVGSRFQISDGVTKMIVLRPVVF